MGNAPAPYADEGWNPVTGCGNTACPCRKQCWARRWARRLEKIPAVKHRKRYRDFLPTFWKERLDKPLHWRKPRVVATCFMGELFDPRIWHGDRRRAFLVMEQCPQHTFFVLTKRPDILREYAEAVSVSDNVFLGVSVTCQADADKLIPELLACDVPNRWVSYEPAMEYVDFTPYFDGLNWVVMGCEKPFKGDPKTWYGWASNTRDACAKIDYCHRLECIQAQFYLKQGPSDDGKSVIELPKLDGRTWEEVPW